MRYPAFLLGVLLLGTTSSVSAQQNLDQSARALGFRSFQHYQQAQTTCMDLLNRNPLLTGNLNCGTDMECYQREGTTMQRRYNQLTQSQIWINNKCDVVIQVESARGGRYLFRPHSNR